MTTVTFNRAAAVWMWWTLGLFGTKQECYACGEQVKPKNVGAFKVLDDLTIGVWHHYLPCILALQHIENIRQSSGKEYGQS